MSATLDYGIDLGTTNSSIGVCRHGEVRIFQSTELMNVTPSVVHVSRTGRLLVGKKAYDVWVADPENTQSEFKRWIGYSDQLGFPASGKQFSAEALSAEILKSLRADAERHMQERVTAAVITVPAAFGSLQCEATARAARLAGFEHSPLLQEPIAAAIAYGASPASRNQRWMVFDLGGGTLDIAIVSTRNDQLAILEHQGNNRLGGKDIDQLIVAEFLLPALAGNYNLPGQDSDPKTRNRLVRTLVRHAEVSKIALSTATEVVVDIFDAGDDVDGRPIEASIRLKRDEVDSKLTPILDQCLALAQRALEGARLSGAELDRIFLVGGPTQMPIVRSAIESGLKAKISHSLDPMTVVSYGAALYASTLDGVAGPTAVAQIALEKSGAGGAIPISLAYERASGSAQSPVAGAVDPAAGVHEVKIDASGGFWTSGWLPVVDGNFEVDVMLHDVKPLTTYTLSARDQKGNPISLAPAEFAITFMLPMAAPPLPHTMAIELSTEHGVMTFDPIFKRHCPLPAEVRKTYKADRTLRPSEPGTTLPIKFWEIEVSDDPQEKWWAGCIHIRAEWIKRPLLAGTELELTIKIDASRQMTVALFIPLLNQSFSNNVYIPDPPSTRSQLQQQIDVCFLRLEHIRNEIYQAERAELTPQLELLEVRAEKIAEQFGSESANAVFDPDISLNATNSLRVLRIQLTQLEEQLELRSSSSTVARKLRPQILDRQRMIERFGTVADQQEFERLRVQFERYADSDDVRGLHWTEMQMRKLREKSVNGLPAYWQDRLSALKSLGYRFTNQEQATRSFEEADKANEKADLHALRSAVQRLWSLMEPDELEKAMEQESRAGLRA